MSKWKAHAWKGFGSVNGTSIKLDAESAEDAAFKAVEAYWFEYAGQRDELFDAADEAERTIVVTVWEPSQRNGGSRLSKTRPQPWLGTVTPETPSDPDRDEAKIRVEETRLRWPAANLRRMP